MKNIFISSNAFPKLTLDAIFAESDKLDIKYLELGSGVAYDPDARQKIIKRSRNTTILLHNYIPAPAVPFVLNLSSTDNSERQKSLSMVKTALEISAEIDAPFYAVHSGFAYHAKTGMLGKKQTHLEHFSLIEADKIFRECITEAAIYAKQLGVELLIENNAVEAYNLTNGENKSFLVAGIEDSLSMLSALESSKVWLLLDAGHLKVAAAALGFSALEYMEKLRPYIKAFQLSDNNGQTDEHRPMSVDSWFLPAVKTFLPAATITLEVNGHLAETLASRTLL